MKDETTAPTRLHMLVAAFAVCRRVDVQVDTALGSYDLQLVAVTVTHDAVVLQTADEQRLHYGHAYIPPFRGHNDVVVTKKKTRGVQKRRSA